MVEHVCPVWLGPFLASRVRGWLLGDPNRLLKPHVSGGMVALDLGCGMGFFSLPLAGLVGSRGRVICVDLLQGMLDGLRRRASKAGLLASTETRRCGPDSLGLRDLRGQVDFALAFAVVHEVPAPAAFFAEVREALRPGGRLLLAESRLRMPEAAFSGLVAQAEAAGLGLVASPIVPRCRAALLVAHAAEASGLGPSRARPVASLAGPGG